MESKPTPSYAVFSLFIFIIFFNSLRMVQNTGIPVRVGVVLDKEHYVGEMGLKCITMALSDFYSTHAYYKTRLVLNYRDSKKDIVGAAAAALDLVKNVKVQAIIGPLTSGQANFVINLGDKARVPIITFSASSPSLLSIRSPYFIRASLSDSSQVQAIAAIIQAFGWREVVPVYMDNAFGEGIMPFLADALEKVNARIPYRSVIPPSPTDDQIVAELYKLMTMQTRVFVVHLITRLGNILFTKAKQLGMMSKDYAWIITDGMGNELTSIDPSVMESMRGVIGVRPHIPKTEDLDNFTTRYKKMIQQNNPTAQSPDLNTFGLWAYDSAIALALAVEKAGVRNATYRRVNISGKSTDLQGIGVSSVGTELIQALSDTIFTGLAGEFELVNGQLQPPPYEIVNVVGPKARVVGYWMKEKGIVRELNFINHSSSMSNIIWPGKKGYPPKGWVIPTSGKKLKIGVPVKEGFSEFMLVTWNSDNSEQVKGYCRDVFDVVMKEAMPYGVEYEYVPYATPERKSAGSYNDLVYQVYLGNFDAAVGDVTIRGNRSQYVDFTLPYTESGVSMVVPIKGDRSKNALVFLKPLTWKLWVTSFCSFVFMGLLIWVLEHRINEDFRGPLSHQVGMIFWFAFSTMVFAHKERVMSNLSRFVLIIWFLVVLILTQSYTASLTSMLTVQQLQPTITDLGVLLESNDNVGYQNGTFVFGMLKSMGFQESRLFAYDSIDEVDDLLSKGTANGGIAAAFDEIPYMKLFLAKYCSKYIMVGPTYKADGFGFVFPKGSPLVPDISRAILTVTEGEKMMRIEKKWLGDDSKCPDSSNLNKSNSLGLESFLGLFLIVGVAAFLALLIYVVRFLHQNWHLMHSSGPELTTRSKMLELFRRFNNKDLSCHMINIERRDQNDNNCECGCLKIAIESLNEHFRSTSPIFSPCTNGPPTPSPVFSTADEQHFPAQQDRVLDDKMTNQESRPTKQEIELVIP